MPTWAAPALAHTYVAGTSCAFAPTRAVVTVPDGHGGTLSGVVGQAQDGTAAGQIVFLWHDQRFFGWDYRCTHATISIAPAGSSIAVTYPTRDERTRLFWMGTDRELGAEPDLGITCPSQDVVYRP